MKMQMLAGVFLVQLSAPAQLIEQDFNSSAVVSDYISPAPAAGKFNGISSSGAGVSVTIAANQLRFTRAGANTGSLTRNTDMSGPPSSLMMQFDLSVTGSTTAVTSICTFYVGNNFSTTNTTEANADVFARFTVNTTTTDGNFVIRDITNGVNSVTLTGQVKVTWVINNSGSTINYKAPDGTIASVANDKADIWANESNVFNDVNVQTGTQMMADMKFIVNQGSQTIDIDNILVDPVPPTTVSNMATDVAANSFTANWTTATGITGYRLDVSKVSDFSTFVAGYEGLLVNGSSTSSTAVTGLTWGNTYYYRVRTSAKYGTGEFQSDHSNTTSVVTGILPVTFSQTEARIKDNQIHITFTNESETTIKGYSLQKEDGSGNFSDLQKLSRPVSNTGKATHTFIDKHPVHGLNLYRIAATEHDGRTEYSRIVSVDFHRQKSSRMTILGNPVGSTLQFQINDLPDGKYYITILSATGDILLRREAYFRKGLMISIPVHSYKQGMYLLRVKGRTEWSEWFTIGGR